MRDFVVNIAEPVFVFQVGGYSTAAAQEEPVLEEPVMFAIAEVNKIDEIMLLRAAAQEAMNDSR